jgi:hypothetical protein
MPICKANSSLPSPVGLLTHICREARRRGKPEIVGCAIESLLPIRTVSGEDVRVPLGALASHASLADVLAGEKIAHLSGEGKDILLNILRERLKAARAAAERFRTGRRAYDSNSRMRVSRAATVSRKRVFSATIPAGSAFVTRS